VQDPVFRRISEDALKFAATCISLEFINGQNPWQFRKRIGNPIKDSYCCSGRNDVFPCNGSSGILTASIGVRSFRFMTACRTDLHRKHWFHPYMNLLIKVFDFGHNYIFQFQQFCCTIGIEHRIDLLSNVCCNIILLEIFFVLYSFLKLKMLWHLNFLKHHNNYYRAKIQKLM